jgi:hypothetical protein
LEETGKRGGRPRRRKTDVLEIAAIFHIHRSPNNSILGLETYCWAEKIPAIIGPKKMDSLFLPNNILSVA